MNNINEDKFYWGNHYLFTILTMDEAWQRKDAGVFIFVAQVIQGENKSWIPYFIGETDNIQSLQSNPLWKEAQEIGGVTHIHIFSIAEEKSRKFYLQDIMYSFTPAPVINRRIQSEIPLQPLPTFNFPLITGQLSETKSKLELLYQYEKHYLELIKEYKDEIKFANNLQEDLRRERSQFFAQTLKDITQTMKEVAVNKTVSDQWIQELVDSYTKSIDLSSELAKTRVTEMLNTLTAEAKREREDAQLNDIGTKTDDK